MADARDVGQRFAALKRLILNPRGNQIPVIRQMTSSDCGAAALAMVMGYHDKHVTIEEIRRAVGAERGGTSAEALLRVASAYGLQGRAVRAEIEDIEALPKAAILHWKFNHFVVFDHQADRHGISIVDPAAGRRVVSMLEFRRAFTGVVLILEPTEKFEPRPRDSKPVYKLFGLIFERRDLLVRVVWMSLLIQLLGLAMPLVTGVLIDRVVPRRDYSLLLVLAVGYALIQIFNTAAAFIRTHLLIHLRTQLELRFTMRFMEHLIGLPYSFFQQRSYGDLMVKWGSNTAIREILTSTVSSAFLDGLMATFYLILLLAANGPVTALVIGLAAARLGLMWFMRLKQRQFVAQGIENQGRSQSTQIELLSGIEMLKAMGLERQAVDNWSQVFVEGLNISIRRSRLDALFGVGMGLLGMASTLVMLFYGSFLVLEGRWTLGTMMAFNAIATGFLNPLQSLVSAGLQLQLLEVYVERLNDVMETPPEQDASKVTPSEPLTGSITLEHVTFRYSDLEPLAVQDVSLDIPAGACVALVGRTGSGKSTLARILAGLYRPMSGRVLFDGRDLTTLELRSVRNQLGIVTQETHLFNGSIRRNIAFADTDMRLDQIVRAAKLACIHDEIVAMPMGYELSLSDRGTSLSGGQRQRLAIARAVASDPKILILDEATSHLDAVTEQQLQRNLAQLQCTRVVIAHRLSTVVDADLILVLDGGRIVETGTHDQLLSAQGYYTELVGSQAVVTRR